MILLEPYYTNAKNRGLIQKECMILIEPYYTFAKNNGWIERECTILKASCINKTCECEEYWCAFGPTYSKIIKHEKGL